MWYLLNKRGEVDHVFYDRSQAIRARDFMAANSWETWKLTNKSPPVVQPRGWKPWLAHQKPTKWCPWWERWASTLEEWVFLNSPENFAAFESAVVDRLQTDRVVLPSWLS